MKILKGAYRTESGLLETGVLMIDFDASGNVTDEGGHALKIERYESAKDMSAVSISSPHGVWEFIPDQTELDRVGISV